MKEIVEAMPTRNIRASWFSAPATHSPVASLCTFFFFVIYAAGAVVVLIGRGILELSGTVVVASITVVFALWAFLPRHRLVARWLALIGLILLFLVAIFLGYRFIITRPIQSSVSSILAHGGCVDFDYRWKNRNYFTTTNGWVFPSSLRELLGDCMFADVGYVDLQNGTATEEEIMEIDFRPFQSVSFAFCPVTDQCLQALCRQTQFRYLDFTGTLITDDGLRPISTITTLEVLDLSRTNIGDAGVEHLKQVRTLKQLYIWV